MREIQDPTKSDSNSNINGSARTIVIADGWDTKFDEDSEFKRLKNKNSKIVYLANQKLDLINYIKNNVKINFEVTQSPSGWDHKACCPFKDHHDKSPSFFVNSQSNSFKCLGCGKGGGPVHFISHYFGKNIIDVAEDIISKYSDLEDAYSTILDQSQDEVDALVLDLNDYVRNFILSNKDKPHYEQYFMFVENLMWSLDVYLEKHYANRSVIDLNNITEMIKIIKSRLNQYEQKVNI